MGERLWNLLRKGTSEFQGDCILPSPGGDAALSLDKNSIPCPRGIALRVDIILSAAEGIANHAIVRNLAASLPAVLLWRKRFQEGGKRSPA